jgi:threonine/homoserine/homoserine lactone efflux protein
MLDLAKIFFITLLVSMIGSAQIGPISILVIFTTIKHNLKAGLKVAFVGILPEFLYSMVAYFGYNYLSQKPEILHYLELAVIPLFLIFGIMNFIKKEKESREENNNVRNNAVRAFKFGIFNPFLISFWLLSLLIIGKFVRIETTPQIIAFCIATGTGGFCTKCIFGLLTLAFRDKVFEFFKRFPINKILGALIVLLAIVQTVKILIR